MKTKDERIKQKQEIDKLVTTIINREYKRQLKENLKIKQEYIKLLQKYEALLIQNKGQ